MSQEKEIINIHKAAEEYLFWNPFLRAILAKDSHIIANFYYTHFNITFNPQLCMIKFSITD